MEFISSKDKKIIKNDNKIVTDEYIKIFEKLYFTKKYDYLSKFIEDNNLSFSGELI